MRNISVNNQHVNSRVSTVFFSFVFACAGLGINAQWTSMPVVQVSITSFATNGTAVFAGGPALGVDVSLDDGDSWEMFNDGLTDPNVMCMAVSGTGIFAGTLSGGVFRYSELDDYWWAVNNGLMDPGVNKLAVSGTNIFAGTFTSGVFLSTNNGDTWAMVNSGLPANSGILGLAAFGSTVLAGLGDGAGAYRSTNDGDSWTSVSIGSSFLQTSFVKSGTTIYAGTNDGVFKSTNDGSSWSPSGLQGMSVSTLAVSGTTLFAGAGEDGVYKSSNNGSDWSAMNDGFPTQHPVISLGLSATSIFAGFADSDNAGWKRPLSEVTGISESTSSTNDFSVYPNPVSQNATLGFSLVSNCNVTITIENQLGQKVMKVNAGELAAGYHQLQLDVQSIASGVYVVLLNTGSSISTVRMMRR